MKTKKCNKCGKELELTNEFRYSDSSKDDWFYTICKACKNNAIHKYQMTDSYRERHRQMQKKYHKYKANHRKEMGYNRIHKRAERIIKKKWRPSICPICWEGPTMIVAHHPDYSKWNEVVFCCRICHYKIHSWEIRNYKIANLLECKLASQNKRMQSRFLLWKHRRGC